jgi:hypothetical protein
LGIFLDECFLWEGRGNFIYPQLGADALAAFVP